MLNRAGDLEIKEMEKSWVLNAFVPLFLLLRFFFLTCPSSFILVAKSVEVNPQQMMIKSGTAETDWIYTSP